MLSLRGMYKSLIWIVMTVDILVSDLLEVTNGNWFEYPKPGRGDTHVYFFMMKVNCITAWGSEVKIKQKWSMYFMCHTHLNQFLFLHQRSSHCWYLVQFSVIKSWGIHEPLNGYSCSIPENIYLVTTWHSSSNLLKYFGCYLTVRW